MKRRKGHLSRRELLARGAALGGATMVGAPGSLFAQEAAAPRASGSSSFGDLAESLRGRVLTPADSADYDAARALWNGMIDKRPAAIVRCAGPADVIDVVNFARSEGFPVSVRAGGHNVAGRALRDDALTIDVSTMKGIRVDPGAKRARAQGGVTWAELDDETVAHNLVTTGGTVSSTGIAGLTLGGGFGWLQRKYGFACDNLTSVDIVTADGRLLTASDSENADLFWAVRGGGGNFGVVTSFEYTLHDLEPIIGGIVLYPRDRIADLFGFYREFTSTAPDSVMAYAGVLRGPEGTAVAGEWAGFLAAAHFGPVADGERLLEPIKAFGPAALDTIGPIAYPELQAMFGAGAQPGRRNYWRSNFMTELGDDAIEAIIDRLQGMPAPLSSMFFEQMEGAVGRVAEQATAFANRSAKFNCSVASVWTDESDDEQNIAWTREFGDTMTALARAGGYINYMTDDEGEARIRAAYGANYERLVEVKRTYDPENFFDGNQNIRP
jgi:FAD/FMN-containing dehydrogenase